ncbi:NAD(P)/FAD-dependent oxidoreductase [Wansuia hejianensis]|uniref:NAD(P)/FAD-dependent oxidoreductase n=1 Tax=Wansuia hejianensis TaxID=2763667 RepID=A0A926ILV4_9FIRM|nr:NAD(P)/FAD-dependent oxidoreductase [Wansuia hejianensis]MBC8590549.1 NAD(P)/FAD-dependent oxidoreductase [Wansuia hejianensis]
MKNKIAIIGAGPAGIIAAGFAANNGNEVYLIEKNNKIGKKLYITGKGRCNITNASPIDEFFDYIITNKNFLYSSLYSFTNDDIINLLKEYGLKVNIERGNRVFPESNKSSDVIKALNNFLTENKVNIMLNSNVNEILNKDESFQIDVNGELLDFDKIILATGGKSYPSTGSTGDGYIFAKNLGHTIIPIKPSLVPIVVSENWVRELQGLSLRNVNLRTYLDNKLIHSEFGEMIFTHYGISGPIVLSTSNYLHNYKLDKINFKIDFKPALDLDKLNNRIIRDFQKYNNKMIKNALSDLLPQKIIPKVIEFAGISFEKMVNQITKEERENLVEIIKNFPLKFDSFRSINEAIVTSGGISTKEINPSTMESKIIKGLYFAGEIIDVDALTGGFNLQIAYSTGYLAGINI